MKNRNKPSKLVRLTSAAVLAGSAVTGLGGCGLKQAIIDKFTPKSVQMGDYDVDTRILLNQNGENAAASGLINIAGSRIDENNDNYIHVDEYNRYEAKQKLKKYSAETVYKLTLEKVKKFLLD